MTNYLFDPTNQIDFSGARKAQKRWSKGNSSIFSHTTATTIGMNSVFIDFIIQYFSNRTLVLYCLFLLSPFSPQHPPKTRQKQICHRRRRRHRHASALVVPLLNLYGLVSSASGLCLCPKPRSGKTRQRGTCRRTIRHNTKHRIRKDTTTTQDKGKTRQDTLLCVYTSALQHGLPPYVFGVYPLLFACVLALISIFFFIVVFIWCLLLPPVCTVCLALTVPYGRCGCTFIFA
jgi:hypothetical protein